VSPGGEPEQPSPADDLTGRPSSLEDKIIRHHDRGNDGRHRIAHTGEYAGDQRQAVPGPHPGRAGGGGLSSSARRGARGDVKVDTCQSEEHHEELFPAGHPGDRLDHHGMDGKQRRRQEGGNPHPAIVGRPALARPDRCQSKTQPEHQEDVCQVDQHIGQMIAHRIEPPEGVVNGTGEHSYRVVAPVCPVGENVPEVPGAEAAHVGILDDVLDLVVVDEVERDRGQEQREYRAGEQGNEEPVQPSDCRTALHG